METLVDVSAAAILFLLMANEKKKEESTFVGVGQWRKILF